MWRSGKGLILQPAPPPAGDELVLSSALLVPRACRLHLRAEPSYVSPGHANGMEMTVGRLREEEEEVEVGGVRMGRGAER